MQCGITINGANFKLSLAGPELLNLVGTADKVGLLDADNLSHRLLPIAIQAAGHTSRIPSRVNLLQMYGVGN